MAQERNKMYWLQPPPCKPGHIGDFLHWYYNVLAVYGVVMMLVLPLLGFGIKIDFGFIISMILAGKMKQRSRGARMFVLVVGWISVGLMGLFVALYLSGSESIRFPGDDAQETYLTVIGILLSVSSLVLSLIPFIILQGRSARNEFQQFGADTLEHEAVSSR